MSATRQRRYRRLMSTAVALIGAGAFVAGCTGNTPESSGDGGGGNNAASDNDETGDTVSIGFSAPAADHGWIAGITEAAQAEAEKYDDVELRVAEGTNDVTTQISQVETFINDGVDAIVLLPFDGAALTPVALQAMEAGIPVINVDREFDDPFASRATILGDNYGMGVSAGTYICEQVGDNPDAVVAEIAGIDSLPLTQDRSQGFADALERLRPRRRQPRRGRLHRRGRRGGRGQPAAGRPEDRRHLEPRRRPGRRRPGRHRERRPRRVHHGRRRRLGQRDARRSSPATRCSRRPSSTRPPRRPTASSSPGSSPRARTCRT